MTDPTPLCSWFQDGEGEDAWNTGCGRLFRLDEGGPSDNNMRFCCYCGKGLDEHPFVVEDDT